MLWKGHGGDGMGDIFPKVQGFLRDLPPPHTLVVHAGSNVIFKRCKLDLCGEVEGLLIDVRKELNRCAFNTCQRLCDESRVIFHHEISAKDYTLYAYEGIHLSPKGQRLFVIQIQQAIRFFNAMPPIPSFAGYPPIHI